MSLRGKARDCEEPEEVTWVLEPGHLSRTDLWLPRVYSHTFPQVLPRPSPRLSSGPITPFHYRPPIRTSSASALSAAP